MQIARVSGVYLRDLQALLTHTNVVLAARNLKLSVPKCIGLVLGVQAGAPISECSLSLGSVPLSTTSLTEGTRYLGLIYNTAAFAGTMRAAVDFPCAVPTFLEMLHTVIEPSRLYGSELWGLLSIPGLWSPHQWSVGKFYSLADVLEVKRCGLIRKWLKLPSSAPSLPLLHDLGCEPLVHAYLRRAVRFYNALLILEDCCAYKGALFQNVEDAFAASRAAKNLVHALFQVLRILLSSKRGLVARFKNGQRIDVREVESAITRRYLEHVRNCH